MKDDLPIQPPTDLAGVAIHLSYLRRDMQTLSGKIDNISTNFVTTNDFKEHLKADEDHENRIRSIETSNNTLAGKMWVVAAIVGVVSTIVSGVTVIIIAHFLDI
jgi:hypothetical protein